MRQIMDQKAGLQFDDDIDDVIDLAAQMDQLAMGGAKKRRGAKKVSKKVSPKWQPFLKKSLARRGKTMKNYMENKALRQSISAEWVQYKKRKLGGSVIGGSVGAYDDYEEDYEDDYEGGSVIGGGKKKAARKAVKQSKVVEGVKVCQNNIWTIDMKGAVVKSRCNKATSVDPDNPYSIKMTNKFEYLDDNLNITKRPNNNAQFKTKDEIKNLAQEAKEQGTWGPSVQLQKPRQHAADELLAQTIRAAQDGRSVPYGLAAVKAYEKGDNARLNEIAKQLVILKSPGKSDIYDPQMTRGPSADSNFATVHALLGAQRPVPLVNLLGNV